MQNIIDNNCNLSSETNKSAYDNFKKEQDSERINWSDLPFRENIPASFFNPNWSALTFEENFPVLFFKKSDEINWNLLKKL